MKREPIFFSFLSSYSQKYQVADSTDEGELDRTASLVLASGVPMMIGRSFVSSSREMEGNRFGGQKEDLSPCSNSKCTLKASPTSWNIIPIAARYVQLTCSVLHRLTGIPIGICYTSLDVMVSSDIPRSRD